MMTETNKIWVSVLIVLLVLGAGFFLWQKKGADINAPAEQASETASEIIITKQEIKEANFTGSKVEIAGTNPLAVSAEAYVEARIAEFKKSADIEVPEMRAQFGADNLSANYTIDIDAKYIKGEKTDSIVLSEYAYTGGANGNSAYKVFTALHPNGKIISLSGVIKKEKQSAFTELVKKELLVWQPEGTDSPIVFPDVVQELTFSSFTNWSLDDKNLNLYFSKYEISAGVYGAIIFPLPIGEIQEFLIP